jgi:hypothetical protein
MQAHVVQTVSKAAGMAASHHNVEPVVISSALGLVHARLLTGKLTKVRHKLVIELK